MKIIKELRKNVINEFGKKISQEDLAKALKVSRSTIAMWETDGSVPDIASLQALADFFNVSTDYLLGREDKNSYSNKEKNELTPQEKEHLKNYRQLDADAKARIDSQIEFELYKQAQSAEKEEANLA